MGLDTSTTSEPECVLLIGSEVGLESGFLSVRRPTLRLLTLDRLPTRVGLGAALLLSSSVTESSAPLLRLEVLRPSGALALSVNDSLEDPTEDDGHVWARNLHVLVDETGCWTVMVYVEQFSATRIFDVTSKESG